jgi:Fe-S cluster assembly protein SufD
MNASIGLENAMQADGWPSEEMVRRAISQMHKDPAWRSHLRKQALDVYREQAAPATTDENWRRSSLRQLEGEAWRLHEHVRSQRKTKSAALRTDTADKKIAGWLNLENGAITRQLERRLQTQGVILAPMAEVQDGSLRDWFGTLIAAEYGKFEALATALSSADSFVYVPKGIRVEHPLHFLSRENGSGVSASRLIVVVDEGASLTLVHDSAATASKLLAVRLQLVEIIVRSGGVLHFAQVQHGKGNVWEYSHARARVEAGGSLIWNYASTGDSNGRALMEMDLAGEGANGRFAGFVCANGNQHRECITLQRHLAPHTTSDVLYKAAVLESARSVWRGMVRVEENARGADGYQANRNLVLSDEARVESLPGLEILADDIRCSHGATIGSLDPNEVFYMRTRGMPEWEVRRALTAGFFEPVISRYPEVSLQKRLRLAVDAKMKTINSDGELSLPLIKGGLPVESGKKI